VFPRTGSLITGARCTGTPVCALVIAVFEAEGWQPAAEVGR
jgi:hypothetical protein